jgi:toxin ParE1/3/4
VPEVRLSEAARADLIEIDDYGSERFGDDASDAYQRAIDLILTRLEDYPLLGEARPDYGAGIRCIVHKSHRILYRVEGEWVEIARILHHSRDVPQHLS